MAARQTSSVIHHARRFCLSWAALALLLGGSARVYSSALPPFIGTYTPDTLWALLVFLLVATVRPSMMIWRAALVALGLACGIEFSQLYQAPWINSLRATKPGGLVLGQGFLWSDLVCYSVGVGAGGLLLRWHTARRRIGKASGRP